MKRLLLFICAALIAVSLCSCMQEAGKDVKQAYETAASEVKENMDEMIKNGTVKDGDGYIDDKHDAETVKPTDHIGSTDMTDATWNYNDKNGMTNDNGDMSVTENEFI